MGKKSRRRGHDRRIKEEGKLTKQHQPAPREEAVPRRDNAEDSELTKQQQPTVLEKAATGRDDARDPSAWCVAQPASKDCPICMHPLPVEGNNNAATGTYSACCGQCICFGCVWGDQLAQKKRGKKPSEMCCAFCREPLLFPEDDEGYLKRIRRRVERGDGHAMYILAGHVRGGELSLEMSERGAVDLYHRAVKAGYPFAGFCLSYFYRVGKHVKKDEDERLRYLRAAAEDGHMGALNTLAGIAVEMGDDKSAIRLWKHAAALGHQPSLDNLERGCMFVGLLPVDELADCRRAFRSARDEMESDQRTKARIARERMRIPPEF